MTQTTSQVEAAEREKFEAWTSTKFGFGAAGKAPDYSLGATRDAWEVWIARAALASQQEAAAPVWDAMVESGASALVDSCIAKGHWAHASDESKDIYRGHAKAVLLAARAPVASPAEPLCYISRSKLQLMQARGQVDDADTTVRYFNGFPNWVSAEMKKDWIPLYATPPVGAGGAGVMDARPDSVHSDSGECDRVQGPGPKDAERYQFLRALQIDGGEFLDKSIDAILAKGGDQGEGK